MRSTGPAALLFALLASQARVAAAPPDVELQRALEEGEAILRRAKAEGRLPGVDVGPASGSGKAPAPGCHRLRPGESAVISYPTDDASPTGVMARYGLSRPMENTYLVELNLQFTKGEGFRSPLSPDALDGKYRARANECLAEFSGMLRNERSGKSLVLRLTGSASVPRQVIEIVGAGVRASSTRYPSDIPCPVLLHELLHLLGLPDEYRETAPEPGEADSDCRVIGAKDSVMSDSWESVAGLDYGTGASVRMCRCERKGFPCFELMQKNGGKACPEGSQEFSQAVDPEMKQSLNALNSSEAFVLNERLETVPFRKPAHSSVLYPAHFRAITEPGCVDVNETYYSCAVNAYRSARLPAASGRSCSPRPAACRFGSLKWLD